MSVSDSINPLSLSDEEFMFFDEKSSHLLNRPYLPISDSEERLCKSLVNLKILKLVGSNMYKLTYLGKKMLSHKMI